MQLMPGLKAWQLPGVVNMSLMQLFPLLKWMSRQQQMCEGGVKDTVHVQLILPVAWGRPWQETPAAVAESAAR